MSGLNLIRTCSLVLAILIARSPAANYAFISVSEGDPLPEVVLLRHGGGEASYLGDDTYEARVFAFVKGGHARSTEVLGELAGMIEEFRDRPVHWALVVSGRHGTAWADSVAAMVPAALVLIDENDDLYSTLGVALSPAVGMGTGDRILYAYLPYRKIHYCAVIRAHLQYLLGDIDEDELTGFLAPSRDRVTDSAAAGCGRALKLAGMLIKSGKTDQALIQVENVLVECPELSEAYTTLAEVRRLQGDEMGAQRAERRARDLAGP